eukprot:TRINITY_DN12432_c0_g1_i1.p1 TRINITY_DN12432_c0_g1~~TRINITY_DN12432_c0_g1_i1.p1  ORF type:complete len:550 (-),score=106.03 TRINITY_DN12432_c0_g1_i1:120-1769(-)
MALYPWLVLLVATLALLCMGYVLYHHYVDPKESYPLAMLVVMLSFTVSFLCTLLIPIDIYVVSEGDITSKSLNITISRDRVQMAYLMLFSMLVFLAFFMVPFAYFYGEERGDVGDQLAACGRARKALRSTSFFVGLIVTLCAMGLNFRPGRVETLDGGEPMRWVDELLDLDHSGLNAVSFCVACITFMGVFGWAFYTAYGMAAMPFDWLRGKQSASEQRRELERNIADVRDKYRSIQAKYGAEDSSGDASSLSRMRASDRKEYNRLQREQRSLTQYSYRLQELEQKAGSLIPQLLLLVAPARLAIGASMLATSLLVAGSLLATLVDRGMHSPCGWSCGYTVKQRALFNPTDEILLWLSRFFPLDFLVLGFLVLYAFASSVFGIVRLGIRVLCFSIYLLRPRKSLPQALLVLCVIVAHILLALCMVLLTIAPDYTSYGAQAEPQGAHSTTHRCVGSSAGVAVAAGASSADGAAAGVSCQSSVIVTLFTRITLAAPVFSLVYYLANWMFIGVFSLVFLHCVCFQERQELLDTKHEDLEDEEEGLSLMSFTA